MKKHRSSKRWLAEHHGDFYVQQARRAGYRSRAAYKLLEIDRRDRLFRRGIVVVDLGAAPGGWSQVAAQRVGPDGRVIALDRLPITPLPGVEVLQGDMEDAQVIERLEEKLAGREVDLVISDMAPNISGVEAIDQPRSICLAELAVDFACKVLRPGGDTVVKVFQGAGFDPFVRTLRRHFHKVVIRKPSASRGRSREVYLLGRGFRGR